MPVYEYKCNSCKEVIEIFEKSIKNAKRSVKCPKCNNDAHKILSTGTFKVNGFNESNGYAAKQ